MILEFAIHLCHASSIDKTNSWEYVYVVFIFHDDFISLCNKGQVNCFIDISIMQMDQNKNGKV